MWLCEGISTFPCNRRELSPVPLEYWYKRHALKWKELHVTPLKCGLVLHCAILDPRIPGHAITKVFKVVPAPNNSHLLSHHEYLSQNSLLSNLNTHVSTNTACQFRRLQLSEPWKNFLSHLLYSGFLKTFLLKRETTNLSMHSHKSEVIPSRR